MIDVLFRRFVVFLAVAVSAATALAGEDHERARRLQQAGEILSLEAVLEHVSIAPDSRLLEAELERAGDRWIYELEVLGPDGRVREHRVDAATGEVLGVENDEN